VARKSPTWPENGRRPTVFPGDRDSLATDSGQGSPDWRRAFVAVEHRQPDRQAIGRRPLDAVATVRGDVQPVTGLQATRIVFVGEAQQRLALQQQHPFPFWLVVPEAWRAGLTARDDALDDETASLQELHELLAGLADRRQSGEEVGDLGARLRRHHR
jgi:hypothetical protein